MIFLSSDIKRKRKQLTNFPKLLVRYAALKVYTRYGNVPGMYRNLQKLKPIYKNKPNYYLRLSKLAYQQKLWKQSLTYINTSIDLTNDSSATELYLYKANSLIRLGESAKAIACLYMYVTSHPNDAEGLFTLANEHRKMQQWSEAIDHYQSYLTLNSTDSKASFQLAECYRKLKDYQNAKVHYKHSIHNSNPTSHRRSLIAAYYWLGYVQLTNHPDQATKSFKKVIQLDKELNSKRFGIGVFHEHYKQWDYAVDAYKRQLLQTKNDAELYYKVASLYDKKLHEPDEALMYYEKALALDKVHSSWHFSLANCYEHLKDYHNAAKWFMNAIKRQDKHRPGNYRRLASVLIELGRTEDALKAYREAELFEKPSNIDQGFYKRNIKKAKVRYAVSYEHYPVDDQMIFYESLSGTRMMDSPFAIFENIVEKDDFKNYTHVWVVNTFKVIPDKFRSMDNVIFVKRKSDAYFKYISRAKYLICNSTFDPYVVRKPDQLYLQTSHGIFYKTVGRDSTGSPVGVAGSTRNLLQATHIIVPNEYMAEKQPKSYSIRGIHSGDIAKIGYPRIDVTLNITDEAKQKITSRLGIQMSKKTVLYVPTWRGETKAGNRFDSNQLIQDLNTLAELDVNVIFRGHPISNSLLKSIKFPKNVTIPPPDILTNELLGLSDIVISDYSSVFFDFLVTERPIIHYLYDLDLYKQERGLNLSEEELPGTVAKTSEQLVNAVESSLQNDTPSSHYLAAKERFCPYDDGRSTERIVNWFLKGDSHGIEFVNSPNAAKALCLVGTLTDQSGFSSLAQELKDVKENDDVVTLLFSNDVSKDKEKRNLVSEINNSTINFIVHDKNMPATVEESFAMHYFQTYGKFANKWMKSSYERAYKREARRLFGDSQFDQILNYETDFNYYNRLQENMLTEKT